MFVAIDRENVQAFGPFNSPLAGFQFFVGTAAGRAILGITEAEAEDWGDTSQLFATTMQDFTEAYSLYMVEVQFVGEDSTIIEATDDLDAHLELGG